MSKTLKKDIAISQQLTTHFANQMKDGFGVIVILYTIDKYGKASSREIKSELQKTFGDKMNYNYTSFYRVLSKLKTTYKVIEEKERIRETGPDRIYYCLTPVGKLVWANIRDEYVKPLSQLITF